MGKYLLSLEEVILHPVEDIMITRVVPEDSRKQLLDMVIESAVSMMSGTGARKRVMLVIPETMPKATNYTTNGADSRTKKK